jgi:hypothetical protein
MSDLVFVAIAIPAALVVAYLLALVFDTDSDYWL